MFYDPKIYFPSRTQRSQSENVPNLAERAISMRKHSIEVGNLQKASAQHIEVSSTPLYLRLHAEAASGSFLNCYAIYTDDHKQAYANESICCKILERLVQMA